jgi:hypothetical protein
MDMIKNCTEAAYPVWNDGLSARVDAFAGNFLIEIELSGIGTIATITDFLDQPLLDVQTIANQLASQTNVDSFKANLWRSGIAPEPPDAPHEVYGILKDWMLFNPAAQPWEELVVKMLEDVITENWIGFLTWLWAYALPYPPPGTCDSSEMGWQHVLDFTDGMNGFTFDTIAIGNRGIQTGSGLEGVWDEIAHVTLGAELIIPETNITFVWIEGGATSGSVSCGLHDEFDNVEHPDPLFTDPGSEYLDLSPLGHPTVKIRVEGTSATNDQNADLHMARVYLRGTGINPFV